MTSVLTVNGNSVTVVAMPNSPALESIEFSVSDSVALVASPFTGQTQAQQWPGADMWSGMVTLPPLSQTQIAQWASFLMECRGMAVPFLLGDPLAFNPILNSGSTPVVDMIDGGNAVGSQQLSTMGWVPNEDTHLVPGNYIQVGYRLHRVLDAVAADSLGKAQLTIWPSIRDVLANQQPIFTQACVGLFRLASNKRTWSSSPTQLSRLSFPVMEYR